MKLVKTLTFIILFATISLVAQVSAPQRSIIKDEGTIQGSVRRINFVGSGVSSSVSGDEATVNIAGGSGSFSITEIEIDFNTCGLGPDTDKFETCQVTVTDSGVSTSSHIIAVQSANAATGREDDENEMDAIVCRAKPGTGNFLLTCSGVETMQHDTFKVDYTVG